MTREEVIRFIKEAHFGHLATVDAENKPRVRPIGIDTVYGDDLYFFTFLTTRKVSEFGVNSNVEVAWTKPQELSQVRISGYVSLEEDETVKERFRQDNPIVDRMLPAEARHLFGLYKIKPVKVEAAPGLVPYTEVARSESR